MFKTNDFTHAGSTVLSAIVAQVLQRLSLVLMLVLLEDQGYL